MPNREDEYWAGQKDGLRYCYTHKRYYDERVGCQRCYIDHLSLKIAIDAIPETPELKHCPQCKKTSLFWNKYERQFECLDQSCGKMYSAEEYEATITPRLDETLKCPRCGQMSLVWVQPFTSYQCKDCRKAFTKDEITLYLATGADKTAGPESTQKELPKEQAEETPNGVVPSQATPEAPQQSQDPTPLKVCPSCKQQSLVPSQAGDGYECLNAKCRQTFLKASVDRFNQQAEEKKKELDALKERDTKAWFGTQYYDSKRKKWRDGEGGPGMLRWPVKIALILLGALGVLLGAHGLYVYFKLSSFRGMLLTAAAMESSNLSPKEYLSQLFLAWNVPSPFQGWVLWTTTRGFESWLVPAALIVGGLLMWGLQSGIYVRRVYLPRPLEKLRRRLW